MIKRLKKKWSRRKLMIFLERLELYMNSGLTLNQALEAIISSSSYRAQDPVWLIHQQIISGQSLASSLNLSGLNRNIVALIEQGEYTGQLPKVLKIAHGIIERTDNLIKKCLSASLYPMVIAFLAMVLTIGLVRGIMPQIIPMFKGLKVELPILTKIMIFLTENLVNYGLYFLILLMIMSLSLILAFRFLKSFKVLCQRVLIRLPILGRLSYALSLSIFCQNAGSLIESGIPSAQAYIRSIDSISLHPLVDSLQAQTDSINQGGSFGLAFQKPKRLIPEYLGALIATGEASASLDKALYRSSQLIDHDLEELLKRLTTLVEPIMMLAIGLVVGAIALSIMLPIYELSQALQK